MYVALLLFFYVTMTIGFLSSLIIATVVVLPNFSCIPFVSEHCSTLTCCSASLFLPWQHSIC